VTDDEAVVKEIYIEAAPADIFPYLTRTDQYLRWMGVSAELDPTPGGVFRFSPNGREEIVGQFVVIEPPSRIVFTWGWNEPGHPLPAGSTTVEIELIPRGSGTLLRLVHRGLAEEWRERHSSGWSHYLARLATTAAGGDPGPDPRADPAHRHG
jgi:uncharacterized protein YndB with AHSA1/START domain